jgi:hypothetical protein
MSAPTISVDGGSSGTLESQGVISAVVTLRTQATSELVLEVSSAFDAAEAFPYGATIALSAGGGVIFRGKVARNPRMASAQRETQQVVAHDAWDELERTTYHESWKLGTGTVMLPRAVLGLSSSGTQIDTGAQIAEAVNYAASVGCDIQFGGAPTGFMLWPSEVSNVTVADVIRQSMRYHPDWVLWLDHASNPATLQVSNLTTATARSVALDGTGGATNLQVRSVSERVPAGVRIVYEATNQIDGAAVRTVQIDTAGAEDGPGVLSAVIQLAGAQVQSQTQRVETRNLPTDQATAKAWLKLKWPDLADIPDAAFNVTTFSKRLVPEGPQPPGVNDELERLAVADVSELPRELVRGQIEDWMQVKVAEIAVVVEIKANATTTEAQRQKLPIGRRVIYVTGTTATTKTYRGIANWQPAESAPAGIASAIYTALQETTSEGSLTLVGDEVDGTRWHGCRISLLGTGTGLIHSARHDIMRGETTIEWGPPPYLSPGDWMELQKALRRRAPTWTFNRDSSEPEPASESVGGYDKPTNAEVAVPRSGANFKITYWGVTGFVTNFSPPELEIERDTDMLLEVYYLDGIAHLEEPDGWGSISPAPLEYDIYSIYPTTIPL